MILPSLFLLCATAAPAQTSDKGYVVRVDSNTVWLDMTAADGAAPGRAFEIDVEGAKLKHPVTGADLGRVLNKIADGTVKDVSEKFSTGVLASRSDEVKVGQRARWISVTPVPSAPTSIGRADVETRAPKTRGATLNYSVTGMAIGDFDGAGKPQIVLASENAVHVYSYPALEAKPLAEAVIAGTGVRILGLEAADTDTDGRAELFVSLYDDGFKRFETRVMKLEAGKWLKAAELPFLVRGYQDAKGKRLLATQQVVDDKTFPLGNIYPLVYSDGKYTQGPSAIRFKQTEWVYGLTTAQLGEGDPALLFLSNGHSLRVQLGKNWWRTPDDDYGQTPIRVRWEDRLLEFNPPMAATYGASGTFEALYAVRNMAALGGLASPFGLFNRGELLRKRWNGLALETAWKADLPGCAQGLAVVETAPGRAEIAVAVRGSAEQSSVWTFDP